MDRGADAPRSPSTPARTPTSPGGCRNLLEAELDETRRCGKLYDELEVPLIEVLAELEFNGIRLDVPFLQRLGAEMASSWRRSRRRSTRWPASEFNIALAEAAAEGAVRGAEAAGPEADRHERRAEHRSGDARKARGRCGHALPQKIIEHRQIAKLKGTYVDALPALVNPKTGRVHTSFNQTVAATGRLSSSDPNLQNIPARTRAWASRSARRSCPQDGWTLLTADYSQIELRLLAHFCGDEALRTRVRRRTATSTRRWRPRSSTCRRRRSPSDQRRVAKTVNFGVIYGMSAFGLASGWASTAKEAERFIDAYFARYPKVLEYQAALADRSAARRATSRRSSAAGGSSTGGDPRRRRATRAATRPSARRSTWRSRARPPT